MKNLFSKILAKMLYALWYGLSLLPLRVLYVLSDAMYVMVYYLARYRRRVVRGNLSASFPEKTADELRGIERKFYHFFCDYIVETVKMMTISREEMSRRMRFTNLEVLQQIVDEGQSVTVFLGHYGNWEWVSSMPLQIDRPVRFGEIYHPLENPYFDKLFLKARERHGAACIPMANTLRWMLTCRQQGEVSVVGFIADQVPLWNNIHHWLSFLNHEKTPVFTGAERIARRQNQAVVYLDMQRVKRGYYVGDVKLITREPQQTEEWQLTEAYFAALEQTIRRDPPYWLWSHNRWKRTYEEFCRRYEYVGGRVVPKHSDSVQC